MLAVSSSFRTCFVVVVVVVSVGVVVVVVAGVADAGIVVADVVG